MDLSFEINDDYDHLDENLEYILENVLNETVIQSANVSEDSRKLKESFNTLLLNRCDCNDEVSKQKQQQCLKCYHGGSYVFDEDFQELVLNTDQAIGRDLIYECTKLCGCIPEKCANRVVQRGPRKFLQIINSPRYNSKGLRTVRDIPKGAFICEYAGELLTLEEAQKVVNQNEEKHKMNYVLFLRESPSHYAEKQFENQMVLTIVDPSKKGNIGRYLNHSCKPNCRIVSVRIDCPIPKIAIFSNRFIETGEELCFNYNEGIINENHTTNSKQKRIACLCKSENCQKYLPNSDFM